MIELLWENHFFLLRIDEKTMKIGGFLQHDP